MNRVAWYERISPLYDAVCRPLYAGPRRTARAALAVRPGERVLDLCCGSGLSLPGLAADAGPAGRVVGVDGSPRMLARARRRTAGLPQIRLVEADLLGDAAPALRAAVRRGTGPAAAGGTGPTDGHATAPFDALHIGLALAVVEDWRAILDRAWALLRPGGRCVVWDTRPLRGAWRPLNPLFVPAAGWTGRADLRRPTWEALDGRAREVAVRHHLGGFVFVAWGLRPSGAAAPAAAG